MRGSRSRKFRVTPALVVSTIALFVALAGTGVAAEIVPLAKRAVTADTAKVANRAKVADKAKVATTAKSADSARTAATAATANTATTAGDAATLNGMTAAQIAATPGPASSLPASTIALRTDSWQLDFEDQLMRVTAQCQAGERAIGGGWSHDEGLGYVIVDAPRADRSGWQFAILAESGDTLPASGTVYAICMKVS